MQVEFVGLPGCGKSTLASALEKRLKADGFQAQGLRNAAKAAIASVQDKIGFLRRRGERVSLYGCFLFAHKNPDLFEWMFRMSHKDFVALSWGMEALSQVGILQEHGAPDLIVLNDEGFLQRLSWNFKEMGAEADVLEVSRLLPDDFLTVHLTITPDAAFLRTQGRKKGIPIGMKGTNEADILQNFTRYGAMIDQFVTARRQRGCMVCEVDASQEINAVAEDVLAHLQPYLPTVLRPAPRKRRAEKA